MKNHIIRILGLKGSWSWAKRQMIKGKIIRSRSWNNANKIRIYSDRLKLIQESSYTGKYMPSDSEWTPFVHHIDYENLTDYEVVHSIPRDSPYYLIRTCRYLIDIYRTLDDLEGNKTTKENIYKKIKGLNAQIEEIHSHNFLKR